MKIRIFKSGKGDCLLLTSSDGRNVLVDGGVPEAYKEHLVAYLGRMRNRKKVLDLVYISHIDRDHIGGILKMLDSAVQWRIYDYQRSRGNKRFRRSSLPKPPDVRALWHNAFFDKLTMNTPDIIQTLTHSGAVLAGSQNAALADLGARHRFLGLSVGEAIQVSRRIGKDQLNIPLNPEYKNKFMLRRAGNNPALTIGNLNGYLLGPTPDSLQSLIDTWNQYLKKKRDYIRKLNRRHEKDEANLPSELHDALAKELDHRAEEFWLDRKDVTPPNLASIMVLFEEAGKRLLLTGDGAWEDILAGLKAHGMLDNRGRIHVDVLKVPHHGAHNSFSGQFARNVIADHYVFCGDGEHHNPEPEVVEGYLKSRLGKVSERSTHPDTGRRFKFWFNCSDKSCAPEHLELWRKIRSTIRRYSRKNRGRLHYRFMSRGHYMTLNLG